jgi:hypothetical protein
MCGSVKCVFVGGSVRCESVCGSVKCVCGWQCEVRECARRCPPVCFRVEVSTCNPSRKVSGAPRPLVASGHR